MNDRGALVRRLGVDFDREFVSLRIKTFVISLTHDTGYAPQPLRSAKSLNIFVQNLIRLWRRRGGRVGNLQFIRVVGRRSAVLLGQTRRDLGPRVATMTGVAGHHPFSA